MNVERIQIEEHGYGRLRMRASLPSENLQGAIDHVPLCGWHACNDRYFIRRNAAVRPLGDYLIILTVGGSGEAFLNGRRYRLTPGTVMIFPRCSTHSYGVPEGGRWEFYWMHANGAGLSAALERLLSERGSLIGISCAGALASLLEKLIVSELNYQEYELFAAGILSQLLLLLLSESFLTEHTRSHNGLISKIIDYIEKNCACPLSVEEIAARLYVSPEHLIRVFRAETGMTPWQYIRQLRMRRACAYLEESDMSVEEITAATGYRSSSSFIAQFRARYGLTPRAYRINHRNRSLHREDSF